MAVIEDLRAEIVTNPGTLAGGDHTIPICGNDAGAKGKATAVLESFGWKDVLDLGDITNARAMEAYVTLWVRMFNALGTPMINVRVVR